jgi:hypothetical protein
MLNIGVILDDCCVGVDENSLKVGKRQRCRREAEQVLASLNF